ncbi:MAG: DUF2284 domain-containing protein [Lachnospiraceae bacterium]|nr:DUF2284 domain-containing protein [Lachnospiraceae bacterium]
MTDEKKMQIEERLLELPLAQYAWIRTEELTFLERVRYICETECPRYGTSWACPPAVGTVEECREKCLSYEEGFLFTTFSEVADIADLEQTLAYRAGHEETTRRVRDIFKERGLEVMALSTESCAVCETCAYPEEFCRHPEKMFPCVESYGILVTELAEKCDIEFMYGGNVVTWFSLLFFRENPGGPVALGGMP